MRRVLFLLVLIFLFSSFLFSQIDLSDTPEYEHRVYLRHKKYTNHLYWYRHEDSVEVFSTNYDSIKYYRMKLDGTPVVFTKWNAKGDTLLYKLDYDWSEMKVYLVDNTEGESEKKDKKIKDNLLDSFAMAEALRGFPFGEKKEIEMNMFSYERFGLYRVSYSVSDEVYDVPPINPIYKSYKVKMTVHIAFLSLEQDFEFYYTVEKPHTYVYYNGETGSGEKILSELIKVER